jgi:soluble lytic murein transglycosylase-like protein
MATQLRLSGAHEFGIREGAGFSGPDRRRQSDRRASPREGQERRRGDRRRGGLRSALFTAITMGLPHQLSPATPPPQPVATVSVSIDGAIAIPASQAYDDLIREAAYRYDVDAALIRSVMQAESAFDTLAVSRAGARGLMQLMPQIAAAFGVIDPFDPRQNIMGGAEYLRQLLDRYHGNLPLVLASYNAGATAVQEYGGVPPFAETQHYVRRVTSLVGIAKAGD